MNLAAFCNPVPSTMIGLGLLEGTPSLNPFNIPFMDLLSMTKQPDVKPITKYSPLEETLTSAFSLLALLGATLIKDLHSHYEARAMRDCDIAVMWMSCPSTAESALYCTQRHINTEYSVLAKQNGNLLGEEWLRWLLCSTRMGCVFRHSDKCVLFFSHSLWSAVGFI